MSKTCEATGTVSKGGVLEVAKLGFEFAGNGDDLKEVEIVLKRLEERGIGPCLVLRII